MLYNASELSPKLKNSLLSLYGIAISTIVIASLTVTSNKIGDAYDTLCRDHKGLCDKYTNPKLNPSPVSLIDARGDTAGIYILAALLVLVLHLIATAFLSTLLNEECPIKKKLFKVKSHPYLIDTDIEDNTVSQKKCALFLKKAHDCLPSKAALAEFSLLTFTTILSAVIQRMMLADTSISSICVFKEEGLSKSCQDTYPTATPTELQAIEGLVSRVSSIATETAISEGLGALITIGMMMLLSAALAYRCPKSDREDNQQQPLLPK